MSQTVGNKLKQGLRLSERGENFSRYRDVLQFALTADVIDLAFFSLAQNEVNRQAVVLDMDPAAYIPSVPVDRQRQPGEGLGDHQGNKFFRELKRAIVVGASGNDCRKPVGLDGRQHKQIRSSFTCGIRAGWIERG